MSPSLRVGVVGCGVVGRRRVAEAAANPLSRCVVVADPASEAAARAVNGTGAETTDDWRQVVERSDVDAIVVATPNALLAEITLGALAAGKHVLVEKPMGCNLAEAERMRAAACAAGRVLKVGFNHRYHPAIADARRELAAGGIGDLINIRCRYGHGGRPGYEHEWRHSRALAGGGELLDQGVHLLDLVQWFAGVPDEAFAMLQRAVWTRDDLEDNAFGLFRYRTGAIAALHASWTQWKNLFSFEVCGRTGAIEIQGLGGSYGVESLTVHRRLPQGGVPETQCSVFEGRDESWRLEWEDFVRSVRGGEGMLGTADDGVAAMRMVSALYRSAERNAPVDV